MVGLISLINKDNTLKKKVYCKELELLRKELRDLKDCQLKYFTLSITTTGLILGVIARFGPDTTVPDIFYLLPLVPLAIVLPSWFVFFDKAKTITRIVAYYRLLESLIIGNISFNFIGWENSVALFRKQECELEKKRICGSL